MLSDKRGQDLGQNGITTTSMRLGIVVGAVVQYVTWACFLKSGLKVASRNNSQSVKTALHSQGLGVSKFLLRVLPLSFSPARILVTAIGNTEPIGRARFHVPDDSKGDPMTGRAITDGLA